MSTLPTDSADRKDIPLARGLLDYFPAALAEVARLSKHGNDKHNPGEEMHHARGKSSDHADCILRHQVERGTVDDDGFLHDIKVAWRALAQAQEALEARGAPMARGAKLPPPHEEEKWMSDWLDCSAKGTADPDFYDDEDAAPQSLFERWLEEDTDENFETWCEHERPVVFDVCVESADEFESLFCPNDIDQRIAGDTRLAKITKQGYYRGLHIGDTVNAIVAPEYVSGIIQDFNEEGEVLVEFPCDTGPILQWRAADELKVTKLDDVPLRHNIYGYCAWCDKEVLQSSRTYKRDCVDPNIVYCDDRHMQAQRDWDTGRKFGP